MVLLLSQIGGLYSRCRDISHHGRFDEELLRLVDTGALLALSYNAYNLAVGRCDPAEIGYKLYNSNSRGWSVPAGTPREIKEFLVVALTMDYHRDAV